MKWISPTIAIILVVPCLLLLASLSDAKNTKLRQLQEVNFSEMNLKGTIRNPDGAYLVQKKGLKFLPLYNIQKDFDFKIREASLYAE